jgi:Peptidase A4 family
VSRHATFVLAALAVSAIVLAASLGNTAPAGAAQRVNAPFAAGSATDVSANWSGYAATATSTSSFTDVTGTWQIPTATCTVGTSSSAAIWVGLGGYNVGSNSLEQTGTSSDCTVAGRPSYYIWYELVPAASVNVKLKVNPGDTVTSSVVVNGTSVLVQVKDRTRKTSFTKNLTMAAPDLSSAEWIAEAPSNCGSFGFCRVVPLTNFGSLNFSKVSAIGDTTGGTLTMNPGWTITQIQLVPQGSHHFFGDPESGQGSSGAGATPTAPTPDGTGFTVNYNATASASE